MYYPIYQLQGYDYKEAERVTNRWTDLSNLDKKELVMELIRAGGGEDFLEREVEYGILQGFLDDKWDLRGIEIFQEEIDFPETDNFESIDFSYSRFWHSTFRNACINASFSFAKFYNCKFINCIFHFTYWFGCTFENTSFQNCDFVEHGRFTNCDFINCNFSNYSIYELLFGDCRLDSNTKIDDPKFVQINPPTRDTNFDKKQMSNYYKSIYEAYQVGNVPEQSRYYKYLSRKYRTKYLSKNWFSWVINKFLIEAFTGYGLKPMRPLLGAIFTVMVFSFMFGFEKHSSGKSIFSKHFIGEICTIFSKGLWFSLSAFIAFNGTSKLSYPLNYLFLLECCLGIIFFTLFITVLSNIWFTE